MATERELKIVVSAQDLGSKKLEELQAALEGIIKANKGIADSGKASAAGLTALKGSLEDLQALQKEAATRESSFLSVEKDIASAQRLEQQIAETKQKLDALRASTTENAAEQKKLDTAVRGAVARLGKQENAYATLTAKIEANKAALASASGTDFATARAGTAAAFERVNQAVAEAITLQRQFRQAQAQAIDDERKASAAKREAAQAERQNAEAIKKTTELLKEQSRARRHNEQNVKSGFAAFSAKAELITLERQRAAAQANTSVLTRLTAIAQRLGLVQAKATTEIERNTNATKRNAAAKESAAGAYQRAGQQSNRFAQALGLEAEKGKTSLSVYQRVRGQVLSLASAYIGVFQAISLAQRSLETSTLREGASIRLGVANEGDNRKTASDLAFVRSEADRLGQSFTNLATLYSRFRVAGESVNLSLETQRKTFANFSEVATVLRLSQEDVEGVFRALEQSFSKGKVQAEELRGQLGDRLPGAFAKFAQAIGVSSAELDKLIEQGRISSNALPLLGDLLADEVALKLSEATDSFQANINRFKTAFEDFQVLIADSGLRTAVQQLALELQRFFKSEDGATFARGITTAFQTVISIAKVLIQNFDTMYSLLKLFIGLRLAFTIGRWADSLGSFVIDLRATTAATTGATTAARVFGAAWKTALGPIGVLLAIASELIIHFALQTDDAREAQVELAEQTRELNAATGEELRILRDLAEATQRMEQQDLDAAEAKKKKARQSLNAANAALAELRAQNQFVFSAGRRVGEPTPEARRLISKAGKAQLKIDAQQKIIDDVGKRLEERGRDINAATEKITVEQVKLVTQATLEVAALTTELADKNNAARLKSDDAYLNDFAARYKSLIQKIGQIASENRAATLERDVEALQVAFAQAKAAGVGAILPGSEKSTKSAVEKVEKERQRVIEEAEKAIYDARRSYLELNKKDLESQLALIDLEYNTRVVELEALQAKVAAFDPEKAAQLGFSILSVNAEREEAIREAQKDAQERRVRGVTEAYKKQDEELRNLIENREAVIALIEAKRDAGMFTAAEAQKEIDAELARSKQPIIDKVNEVIAILTDPANQDLLGKTLNIPATLAGLEAIKVGAQEVATATPQALRIGEQIAEGLTNSISTLAGGFADVLKGVGSLSDAFKNAGKAFQAFLSDFLIGIGQAILKQLLFNSLFGKNGQGGPLSFVTDFLGGLTGHTGGVVGHGGLTPKQVNPAWFIGAKRFHKGGFPGLRQDEVPAVLQKGEEVLTRTDPRNALNGASQSQKIEIVNAIDSESVVQAGLNTPGGRRAILNVIRADKAALRQMLA